jgi:hypothetical protein
MKTKHIFPVLTLFLLAACIPVGQIQIGLEPTPTAAAEATATPGIPPAEPTATPEAEPQPAETAPPAATAPLVEPAAPAGGGAGYVTGGVCYPSEFIPPMEAYFQNMLTGEAYLLDIHLNQFSYNTQLPAGDYIAFAWREDYLLGGVYSAAIACGLTAACTDHAPQVFSVQAGALTSGIDLCDWYGDPSLVPPVPAAATTVESGEAIMILNPGPGSRITSPLRLSGYADTTFEQNLVVKILADDGSTLALAPTTIQSEMGKRGYFEIELPFTVTGDRQGFIQVYAASPRDGGVTHLSSVGVILSESGPEDIRLGGFHPEQIRLTDYPISFVSGGVAHIEGIGVASFEGTLLVEIYDEFGALIGSLPVMVNSPEPGVPGTFSADVPYSLAAAGFGRIVVRDVSPAFGGDTHVISVEVRIEP